MKTYSFTKNIKVDNLYSLAIIQYEYKKNKSFQFIN